MSEKPKIQRLFDAKEGLKNAYVRQMEKMGGEYLASSLMQSTLDQWWLDLAKATLDAADAPPKPTWPTDESVEVAIEACPIELRRIERDRDLIREQLRAALLADPIIKAAIDFRDAESLRWPNRRQDAAALIAAVNEAGL